MPRGLRTTWLGRGDQHGLDGRSENPALRFLPPRLRLPLLLLVLSTLLAIGFEDRLLERQQILDPLGSVRSVLKPHSDLVLGGSSSLSAGDPSSWTCELQAGHRFPFCGLEIAFGNGQDDGVDLSRTDSLVISYSYRGPGQSLRLNLRNFDSRYSDPGVKGSLKYNSVELRAEQGRGLARLDIADFAVSRWWMVQHKVPPALGRPEFDNVVALQLLTGSEAPLGSHGIAIHDVVLKGRLLTRQEFYLLLLAGWGLCIGGFLLLRIAAGTRALRLEVQARERAEERAKMLARHDSLTGFLNRYAFREELAAALATGLADGQPGLVFLIEVGKLRSVNEVHGHSAGDELLVETARRLQAFCSEQAIAGRMGGNELALYIPGEVAAEAERAATLTTALNQAFVYAESRLNPGATLGAACFPSHGRDYASLFRAVDIALHEAKRAGGGGFRFYNSDLEGGASERIARIKGRERVLKASEERPSFLAHARTDLLVREGCRLAASWPTDTALCLPLSAAEWQEDWTAERIITQLDMSGLARARLTVELSETLYLARAGATLRNLQALQAAGIRLALTGFRNGFDPTVSSIRFDEIRADAAFLGGGLSGGERKWLERRA